MTMRVRLLSRFRPAALALAVAMVAASPWPARATPARGGSGPRATSGVWAVETSPLVASLARGQAAGAVHPDGLRFLAVTLKVGDGPSRSVLTNAATPGDLLAAMGIRVSGLD